MRFFAGNLRSPAVFGATGIFEKVKSGDLIRIDGNTGSIYKASESDVSKSVVESEEAHPVVRAYEEGEVKKEEKKIEKRIEETEEKKEERKLDIPMDKTLPSFSY